MKTLITISAVLTLSVNLFGQNITNTLGTSGIFTVKDGSTSYLSLSQSTGHLTLNRSLFIPWTTSSTLGIIYKGGFRFIHNYQASGTEGSNTFVGINSGNFTMSGVSSNASYNAGFGDYTLTSNTTGYSNSAFGPYSMNLNTTGYHNSSFGYVSLYSNTTGNYNSAFGSQSLYNNTGGFSNSAFGYASISGNTTGSNNSAFGVISLGANTTGNNNSAFGNLSLRENTTGFNNSAFGSESLRNNTIGDNNSAFGKSSLTANLTGAGNSVFGSISLTSNTTGSNNSVFGYQSLTSNTSGSNNIAIGNFAGGNITTGSNNIVIGMNSFVPVGTSNNQIRIGNSFISYAGVQVAWTITSDKRWKKKIKPSDLGLSFISKLNPVSYTRRNDESQKTEYGLIAQEVEEALKQEGAENSGMLTIDDKGRYELRYNDLIAPMIKAIQELKEENEKMKREIESLKKKDEKISGRYNK